MPLLEGTLQHCHTFEEMNYSGMTLANKQAMKRIGLACILVSLFIISEIIGKIIFFFIKIDYDIFRLGMAFSSVFNFS